MSPPTSAVFTLHVRCPAGTLAIGGYSPTPEELAVVHAHERVSVTDDATSREEMRPLIPATALRGALREALEGALRGAGIAACRGGDGVPPEEQPQTGDPEPARRCVLDAGQPCRACRLFGTQQGAQRGDGQFFGALVLGDARSATAPTWTVTPGVGIDRSHRSAREGIFFNRQAPTPGSAIEYVAELRLLELPAERGLDADALARRRAQLRHDLKVAIALTGHIGSGTSRGLGRVELRLADAAADADAAGAAAQPAITGDRQLVVTLERPANLGGPFGEENVRRTASVVPGSALRGAIGWAIAERITAAGRHPDDDAVFQALVAEDGAIFDHLHPCEGAPPDGITGPWPITRRRCKRDATHRRFDVLMTRVAASQVRRLDEARAVHALAAAGVRCADHTDTGERCDGPMTPEGGHRGQRTPLERRIITRVSLDGRRRSAREGMLFGTEVLEAGARFVGSIRRVPPGAEAHLAAGLAAPLSLGRGRSMGWGRARVELAEPAKRASLAARGAVFEAALAGTLAACALAERLAVDRVVALTCLTPLIGGEGDDAAVVGDALGAARPVVV
ncbi:MAG: RAMP superfamily CRISPR-associated protein, partial [bacterium]